MTSLLSPSLSITKWERAGGPWDLARFLDGDYGGGPLRGVGGGGDGCDDVRGWTDEDCIRRRGDTDGNGVHHAGRNASFGGESCTGVQTFDPGGGFRLGFRAALARIQACFRGFYVRAGFQQRRRALAMIELIPAS